MKVKELISELQNLDQDRVIILSKDAEGNDYGPLYNIAEMVYIEDGGESYVKLEKLTPELKQQGYTEEDLPDKDEKFTKAVIFWP